MRRTGLLLALVLATSSPAAGQDDSFQFSLIHHGRGLTPHKEIYGLPYSHSSRYNEHQAEVVFQFSAKHDILGSRFYFAYTQISFWQAYDSKASSPFRDTNYNPELFYRWREYDFMGAKVGGDLGFEHQSNGQRVPLSRSWNLLYASPWIRGDRWMAYLKVRYRIPEDDKPTPDSAIGDDNPDITDYLGHTDLHLHYVLPKEVLLHLLVRGYVGTDKGNASLNASIPLMGDRSTYLVVRLFSGFGESMLDYDKSINRVGVGLMFNR